MSQLRVLIENDHVKEWNLVSNVNILAEDQQLDNNDQVRVKLSQLIIISEFQLQTGTQEEFLHVIFEISWNSGVVIKLEGKRFHVLPLRYLTSICQLQVVEYSNFHASGTQIFTSTHFHKSVLLRTVSNCEIIWWLNSVSFCLSEIWLKFILVEPANKIQIMAITTISSINVNPSILLFFFIKNL
jgi:hypothetical protein